MSRTNLWRTFQRVTESIPKNKKKRKREKKPKENDENIIFGTLLFHIVYR